MSTNVFDLTGRRALITGSARGIGLALARGLASAGAAIVLNGRDRDRLEISAAQLRSEGHSVATAVFDVTEPEAVAAAIGKVEQDIGPIEILVNNAGIQRRMPLEDFPIETWREIVRANLDSIFFVAQAVARGMIARGAGGKIINICSVQSELARPSIAPYTATKGAVKMLTKGMCADWAKHNIQVNGLGPGYFATELNRALVEDAKFSAWLIERTPARRWGKVEDLVGTAIFLASPASDFVNGQIIYVDGGLTSSV